MVRIVSDTSTLYSSAQARQAGFDVSPLSVTIAGKSYREFDEIDSQTFVDIIRQGNMPTSSQPAIGEVAALYEKYCDGPVVNIAMAHGLSGTYTSAVAAAQMCDHPENITVVNTRTLCGPHRYMVERALELAEQGASVEELLEKLNQMMDSAKSYLLPADFDYLRRGGRLSPLVSYVGRTIHLAPVMTQTEDGTQLTVAGVRPGYKQGIKYVGDQMVKAGVGQGWRVFVCHGAAPHKAELAVEILKTKLPQAAYEIHPLSPAFITQGGPECVSVQYIKEL